MSEKLQFLHRESAFNLLNRKIFDLFETWYQGDSAEAP